MKEPFIDLWENKNKPGWHKRLLGVPSYNFYFDIFFNQRTAPVFQNEVSNELTGNLFNVMHYPMGGFHNHRIFKVWDIPEFFNLTNTELTEQYHVKTIRQYPGFLVNLDKFNSVDLYLEQQLSSRNRKNLRSKLRKLEAEHKISYQFFFGKIGREEYDRLFDDFYKLLSARFEEKSMYNRNLLHWKYYYDLAYPLINEKKAVLFVIYDEKKPITLTLNFLQHRHLFSFIQTYDIDYSNYNLGDISMLKHLQWCLDQNIQVFDLAKGENDYKIKWCNQSYDYYFKLYYKKNSVQAAIASFIHTKKLELSQYLRDKGILGKLFQYDKFFYKEQAKKLDDFDWKSSD
ncbi:GNAT family N-acetyltransferase [Zeaxanthinibacter sp. PT1]|uniref:GNAT family N-acetyltransferase n=1 Tax=Zeaxanthinibacter TaxID=561554 RepID=UPI00234AAE5E|nr:GNAT family N-acetyltransferase [Zeaxanthinibacter sp. PT1]MDC6352763.1 GNAT family N-acetyltransferase [Zeaxanthinibacter sp. PT1]